MQYTLKVPEIILLVLKKNPNQTKTPPQNQKQRKKKTNHTANVLTAVLETILLLPLMATITNAVIKSGIFLLKFPQYFLSVLYNRPNSFFSAMYFAFI